MAVHHGDLGCFASGHIEPRVITGRDIGQTTVVFELHQTRGGAKPDPGQRTQGYAPAFDAFEVRRPRPRTCRKQLGQKIFPFRAAQLLLDLGGQLKHGGRVPLRQHPGMHHQECVLEVGQRPMPEPIDQVIPVRRLENLIQRIARFRRTHPRDHRQQMHIVIAQDGGSALLQADQLAQRGQRIGATIDQIADKP